MSRLNKQRLVSLEEDLQLAAELGKTLLERNKELEATIRHQQSIIEDQVQEIQYLTKQSTTLKEVNDNRLKVYEQLEISIAELELRNKSLEDETKEEKLKVKSLTTSLNHLETRCSDLQSTVEELYAGNKNLANYAKIKKLSIAAAASQTSGTGSDTDRPNTSCDNDDETSSLNLPSLLPKVSRCSGPNSIDGHLGELPSSRHSVYSGPDSILSLNAANPDSILDSSEATASEKMAINKVVKYFENRLLNLQVENAKLKVEDDSGAFSSLATDSRESPKPPPDVAAPAGEQTTSVEQIRVESIQVLPSQSQEIDQTTRRKMSSSSSKNNFCVKCMASLADVTPWTLIAEAMDIMKGTFNIELGKFSASLRMLVRHHRGNAAAHGLWLDKWLAGLLALVGLLSVSRQVLVACGLGWVLDGVLLGADPEQ